MPLCSPLLLLFLINCVVVPGEWELGTESVNCLQTQCIILLQEALLPVEAMFTKEHKTQGCSQHLLQRGSEGHGHACKEKY